MSGSILDNSVFETLQREIEVNNVAVENIKEKVANIDEVLRVYTALLSQVHSTTPDQLDPIIRECYNRQSGLADSLSGLSQVLEGKPAHKYKALWNQSLQQAIYIVLYMKFLSAISHRADDPIEDMSKLLLSPEWVSRDLGIKTTIKLDKDVKLTRPEVEDESPKLIYDLDDLEGLWFGTEDYLHAAITLINEFSRLSVNLVTTISVRNAVNKEDPTYKNEIFDVPVIINGFIKRLQGGFMMLNLKNDSLRRRFDSIKYDVKKTEDVVYDLAVRGLL